ncbi:MAG: hypothetical protein IOC86_16205, partial [Aestuariivirga sp.]|nr:hypothetical protein [Aestuariivirga sp.]
MSWKTSHRSLYYRGARPERASPNAGKQFAGEQERYDLWTPFRGRMRKSVIPNSTKMLDFASA